MYREIDDDAANVPVHEGLDGFRLSADGLDQAGAVSRLRRGALEEPNIEWVAVKIIGPVRAKAVTKSRVVGL